MRDFLAYAAAKYYAGEPVITDAEFDKLAKQYNFDDVGAPVDLSRAIPHAYRMYSLQKCFVGEKQIDLGQNEVIETPKLDGAAVALLYVEGRLVRALTRGDGKAGLDITEKMKYLVPTQCNPEFGTFQVTGEVVAPKNILNSRNYAAGALNLKGVGEFQTRNLSFIAYGVQPACFNTYIESMMWLEQQVGLRTILDSDELLSVFPQDGRVFRVNDNAVFEEMGFTGKHPRGAYALKEIAEAIVTTLVDVQWQVGRTGRVTPVAILEPVMVGDAKISRATLNNIAFIRDMGLEIGCEVEIVRSGEIIPKVLRRI